MISCVVLLPEIIPRDHNCRAYQINPWCGVPWFHWNSILLVRLFLSDDYKHDLNYHTRQTNSHFDFVTQTRLSSESLPKVIFMCCLLIRPWVKSSVNQLACWTLVWKLCFYWIVDWTFKTGSDLERTNCSRSEKIAPSRGDGEHILPVALQQPEHLKIADLTTCCEVVDWLFTGERHDASIIWRRYKWSVLANLQVIITACFLALWRWPTRNTGSHSHTNTHTQTHARHTR